jgi:hypothetical protein
MPEKHEGSEELHVQTVDHVGHDSYEQDALETIKSPLSADMDFDSSRITAAKLMDILLHNLASIESLNKKLKDKGKLFTRMQQCVDLYKSKLSFIENYQYSPIIQKSLLEFRFVCTKLDLKLQSIKKSILMTADSKRKKIDEYLASLERLCDALLLNVSFAVATDNGPEKSVLNQSKKSLLKNPQTEETFLFEAGKTFSN